MVILTVLHEVTVVLSHGMIGMELEKVSAMTSGIAFEEYDLMAKGRRM